MDHEAEVSQLTVDFLFVDLLFLLVAEVIKKINKRIATLDHGDYFILGK